MGRLGTYLMLFVKSDPNFGHSPIEKSLNKSEKVEGSGFVTFWLNCTKGNRSVWNKKT